MRRERNVNSLLLSLDGTINSTQTTINVSGAADLPSDGDFRISTGNEIMKVVARTGNTLTVVRGQEGTSNTSHSNGQNTIVIITKNGFDQMIKDAFGPDYLSMEAPHRLSVTSSDFSWVNQGTSSVQDDSWGGITIKAQNAGPHSLRCLVLSAPSQPYTLVGRVDIGVNSKKGTLGSFGGLLLRESSTGKIQTLSPRAINTLSWFAWNSATSYAATISNIDFHISYGYMWQKFVHDGTDISAYISADGLNWHWIGTISKTARFTTDADQVGFYFANYGDNNQMAHLRAWTLL